MCLAIPGKVTSIEEKNGVRSGLQFVKHHAIAFLRFRNKIEASLASDSRPPKDSAIIP